MNSKNKLLKIPPKFSDKKPKNIKFEIKTDITKPFIISFVVK